MIPAFDEEHELPGTLDALAVAMAAAGRSGEVVVCDNNSRDATAAVARERGARVVFEPVNQISRARNTGARAARGRHLVFLDADSELPPELLAGALAALEGGRVAGGGAAVRMTGTERPWAHRLTAAWNALARWQRLAAGAFVFVRRDAFEAVGGFSQAVYASEEIWFSRAVRAWARPRGLEFIVLDDPPLRTSGRKVEWYSARRLLWSCLPLFVFPFLVRSRSFCRLWYRRPAPRWPGPQPAITAGPGHFPPPGSAGAPSPPTRRRGPGPGGGGGKARPAT